MAAFENKNILITGSSRGIGRACALQFAKEGANVVLNYRKRREEAEDLVAQITALVRSHEPS